MIPGILLTISGTVQGVGFRPFIYRLAQKHGIQGEVSNDGSGVRIQAFGGPDSLDAFTKEISGNPPPLAIIRSINSSPLASPKEYGGFAITESIHGETVAVDMAVDTKVCDNCLAEMHNPADRRFNYPFINCTDCGPRFTIITRLPYDRPNTTMSGFVMCPDCAREYSDPASRRFHAQPISCPNCGPRLRLLDGKGALVACSNPIEQAAALLEEGKILALKGLGGFHLACRTDKSGVVSLLRSRKFREEKPFALMARSVSVIQKYAALNENEKKLLQSIESSVVLAERGTASLSEICAEVAPGISTLGFMLPYTPLHHLLFEFLKLDVLVMTSANQTDEPMAVSAAETKERLGAIVDYTLDHDRPIHVRNDDSIVRVMGDAPVVWRRARGYTPDPLPAMHDITGVVGCGGILKSTVTIGRRSSAYLSQYIGTIENIVTYENYDHILAHLLKLLDVKPKRFIADKHPQAPGMDIAKRLGVPVLRLQHHYGHALACMAENRIDKKCVCVVYDGTGYGDDGSTWGGEFFAADYRSYSREAHLAAMPMPGGDAATHHPDRMALGALFGIIGNNAADLLPWMDEEEKGAVLSMIISNTNCPTTSGMGRLFDAASALLGICRRSTYEGQPAMMLEGAADRYEAGAYPLHITNNPTVSTFDGGAILIDLVEDLKKGTTLGAASARFHNTIAAHTAELASQIADKYSLSTVCLTGGCFQNALLLSRTKEMLGKKGLTVVSHRLVPPNDGGISYGQVMYYPD